MKNNKHIQSFNKHQENLNISDVSESKKSFDGELTSDNIYKYYLEQTKDEKETKKLLDKLIKDMDKLIEKGKKVE
jgi:rubrerythrin